MKKNKTLSRLLTFLLCLAMLVTYMPSTAFVFAGENDGNPEATQEVTDGEQPGTAGKNGSGENATQPEAVDDSEEEPAATDEKVDTPKPKREVKGAENGTEDEGEEPEGPADAPPKEGSNTSANIMDFIPPGTITMLHEDGSPVNASNPGRPGETVTLALTNIAEDTHGLQFDMDEMTLEIPEGLDPPDKDQTGTSNTEVTDPDKRVFTLPNTYVIGADGVIRYIWKNPHTEERNGVVYDVYGLACEAENFKYSISFEMTIGKDADEIKFSDDITFPVDRSVSLTVTKSIHVSDNGVTSISPSQAQQMTFGLFYADGSPVKNKNGENITFTRDDMTGSFANASIEIDGIVSDTYPAEFIVRETGHAEFTGYTFVSSGTDVVTEKEVSIPAGGQGTADLKNEYTKDIGHLKVKKSFPPESDKNFSNLTTDQKKKISFKVYDANNRLVADALLSDTTKFDANGVWDLGTLPPGNYTVVETADLEGYTETTTYTVSTENGSSSSGSGTTAPVQVVTDGSHEVEFANTYKEQTDKLKLKKTFEGAALTDAEKANITFTIKCPDGTSKVVHYSDFTNGEYVLNDALTGTYTVTESNVNPSTANYKVTSTYAVNGGTPKSGTSATNVAVTLNGTNEVDFVNTYTAIGKITVKKTVSGDYWTSSDQANRRKRIRGGVVFNLYRIENGERVYVSQKKLSDFYSGGSATWGDLPVGTYEIDEVISGTGDTGAIIANTIRVTTVKVNDGTEQTSEQDATTIASGNVSVEKGGTATVAYNNDYTKKKGKIKLEKTVTMDGRSVDPRTLSDDQQKSIKFKIGSKVVTLYDVLHNQNGFVDGWLEVDYGTYKVEETSADLPNYIRVTTAKVDGNTSQTTSPSVKIDDATKEHTVAFNNDYIGSGKLKLTKTIEGLTSAEQTALKAQLRFTVTDADGNPVVQDANGNLVIDKSGSGTPKEFTLAEMTAGITLPAGDYIITEHYMDYKTEVYTRITHNKVILDGSEVIETNGPVSGTASVTHGNEKIVNYYNEYYKIGVGVTVRKYVILDGNSINDDSAPNLVEFDKRVKDQIKFEVYEGNKVDASKLRGTYTWEQLKNTPLNLTVGTWTIREIDYNIDNYNHAIAFHVRAGGKEYTSKTDTVTFTLTANANAIVEVTNAYVPTGNLIVKKLFGDGSDLNAENLTDDQKKAIKFTVIGYKNANFNEVVWPEQPEGATEPQPFEFSYYDMVNGEKKFEKIPTGVYVVKENGVIANYTLTNAEYDPNTNGLVIAFGDTKTQTITNTYTRDKGNLEIRKTFEGPLRASENKNQVTFTVESVAKNSDGTPVYSQRFTYADMDSNGYIIIRGLETGDYIVKETNADYDYFERTSTVSVNDGDETAYSDNSGVTASVENKETASVHITNSYKETGALVIDKSFDDSECANKLTNAQKNAVKFTIKRVKEDGTTETVKTITYDEIVKYKRLHPEHGGYRLLVLPGEYVVEESNANFNGYTRETTATVDGEDVEISENNGVSATIAKFSEKSVAFENKYSEVGSLKIKKSVSGLKLTDAQKAAIKFTVRKGDTVIREFTYADMDANGEYTISPLAAGTYTVEETVIDEASTFYGNTRRTFVKVGTGGETENSSTPANVDKNGQTVTFRNVYGNSDKLTVQKEIGGAPKTYIEKNGSRYPVWKFNLRIANLEPSTVNSDGSTDLIDTYDRDLRDLFKVVTDADDLAAIYANDPEGNGKANILTTSEENPTANVQLVENYGEGKVTFRITGVTADTAKSNDLMYYLIPKDVEALERLNSKDGTEDPSSPSNVLKKKFSNVVQYKELPRYEYKETNKVDYVYEKTVVIKHCLNYNTETQHLEDEYGHIVDYALYEFVVNPEKMKLSTKGYIDVTDVFSENQSVNAESIVIKRYDPDTQTESDVEEGDVALKDLRGHSIVLKLKDETCFKVTYQATVLYTSDQIGTPVELNNEVTVEGFKDGIEPTIIPTSTGGGSVYQIRLRKYENGNLDNALKGAVFKMYLSKSAADAARLSGDYSQAISTFTTNQNGIIEIREYTDAQGTTHHITANKDKPIIYYFVESEAPEGYEKIDYTVQVQLAAEGETANYQQYIYLPNDTVGIKDTPFDTMIALGALKTLKKNGSAIELGEGDFTFKIRAKDNANIPMPEGTVNGEKVVPNEADDDGDGKAKAVFGAIAYDTEDVITRNNEGEVTGRSKTFTYEVSEVLPDGLDANGNKDGVHYDTHVYEVAVTVAIVNGELKVTSVTVDGEEVNPDSDKYDYHYTTTDPDTQEQVDNVVPDIDLYFAGLENEYTAKGTWTPKIQKDLKGRPLKAGEFTFQIKDSKGKVLATGTNDANGNVKMDPETLEFSLADLGENTFTVHEVYDAQTNNGMVTVAADETVKVTVSEKDTKDGTLDVTADKATLTAPLVMTNEFKASGSWHPKAEKTMDGALKINAGDYSFELAAVGNAPMPAGAQDGKLVVDCDGDGKVDFGQINFYQDKAQGHNDGDKTFHYTIKEVIPDPADRIFGVDYDDTVYNITVKTTINDTNKLGVKVTCDPADGWELDEETATFTGKFENTYGPEPATAQPGYKKTLEGEAPSEDVEFEFKLEKAAGENGDFDYVKVNDAAFATQTKTLTLGPTTLEDTGLFDEITFLAEGTYKFKITETPNTNGALDSHIVYDPKVYTYTVVVTGDGTALQATGTYSYTDEENAAQEADTAAFTNKYTPTAITFTPKVHKKLNGEPTVKDKTFEFTMTPDEENPAGGAFHGTKAFDENAPETIELTVPAGQKDAEKAFNTIEFKKAGRYLFHVEEKLPATPVEDGISYDTVHWTLTVVVEDRSGSLVIVSNNAAQDEGEEASTDGTTTFTNVYTPNPTTFVPPVKKVMEGEPLAADKTFTFTLEADAKNPAKGAEIANDTTSITVPAGQTNKEGVFEAITFYKAGTYKFTIKETKGNVSQIGYSEEVSYLTVVIKDTDPDLVVDDFEFTEAATAGGASAEFTNSYTPTPVKDVVPVEKEVPGEPLVKDKKFTFTLAPDAANKKGGVFIGTDAFEGTATDTVELTVPAGETNADGLFKELTFKKAGTYKFTVSEVIPEDSDKYQGITYDETVGTVTFVVTDNDGTLEVTSKTFEKAVNEAGDASFFSNPYCPEPVEYTPQVEKTVSGHPTVAEKIFNFKLTPDAQNKKDGVFLDDAAFEGSAEDTTTVTVPAGEITATADFSELQFRKAGTYKFTVSEVKEDEEGITYDEVVGTLTVTVEDKDGYLAETHEYVKNEATEKKYAKFDNDYTPTPVVEKLHGAKVIDGEPQKDEEFRFMVESGGNTAQLPDGSYIPNPMPEETEVTIYGASPFEFGDMTFEWPGEYYYTISEAAGDAMGFTYDTAIWKAKVTVTDMDGYLVAETTYVSDADEETIETQAVFTNTYTTNDLKITKSVTGGTADKSKKFKFTVRLFDRNGDPLEGVYPITGDAEGEVVNGVGTVKLAHGETAYVTEIPVEATWVVEEEDYANYTAKCDKDHGVITVDQLSESNWINKAPEKPDTGDTNNVGGYAGLFGTSLMALLAMLFGRRRRREGEE